MAASVSMEVNTRYLMSLKYDKPGEGAKSSTKYGKLRRGDPESDEYIRQYLLFHYDFCRTEGFGIEWEKFDFFIPQCIPYDGASRSVWDRKLIKEEAIDAIAYYNKNNGTKIVFVKHIEANFKFTGDFCEHWITFWAMDMSSNVLVTKIYQAHTKRQRFGTCNRRYLVPIFRVKPTKEEMAAARIHVDPPCPYRLIDPYKPLVVFSLAGPGDDPVPGTPFIFSRVPLESVPRTWDLPLDSPPRRLEEYSEDNPRSSSSTKYGKLRQGDPESDEYMRQYVLFHYDFYRTQGFGIEWDKFDFFFPECKPYNGAPHLESDKTNEEIIKKETLDAITYYNQTNDTNIVFVEHIEANFGVMSSFIENWITFWAKDMYSLCPEPKIYQAHIKHRGGTYLVPIFRLKPTEEEMAAAPIHVDPPRPYHFDESKPYVVFNFARPGDDLVPGTPFTFKRIDPLPRTPTTPMRRIRVHNGSITLRDEMIA